MIWGGRNQITNPRKLRTPEEKGNEAKSRTGKRTQL